MWRPRKVWRWSVRLRGEVEARWMGGRKGRYGGRGGSVRGVLFGIVLGGLLGGGRLSNNFDKILVYSLRRQGGEECRKDRIRTGAKAGVA